MAKDGLDLGNDGANEGYWRVQMRSEKTGRWVRMKGPVAFDTVHPNYGPISGVGTFEGGARAGVALIKVSGGKLDGKIIEVPATDFEDIEAIIPEDAPGLEEARQLDAADGVIVNAPNVVDADSEVEDRAGTREMAPIVVRDLKVGDIVQQGTPDALFGRITRAYHGSNGQSQIDVTWSDGLSYTMGLDSADMVKSWPSSSFLSKLPTKHSSAEEQIAAVQSYAHQGHSPINGYLRADAKPYREEGGTKFVYNAWGDDYSEQRVLDEIKQLDGLIENSPGLWGDTTLYRFIDGKRLSDEMKLLKPGAILFDKAYTSTARGYGWRYEGPNPDKVRMVISAPAGTKALDIQWFKQQSLSSSGESEVLLPRGTTFVVDKVEGHLVYVSIVPNKQTGLFREYGDVDKNAVENTPLSELGFDPEEEITIYRGVPKGIKDINPGDWVTALPQLAKDYAGGDGEVISMKVKVKDLLSDPSAGEGGYTDEMIYRPAEVVDALKRVSEVSSYADEITGNVEDLMELPYSELFTEIDRNLDNQTVKEIVDLFENTDYGILNVSRVYVVKSEGRENNVYISGDIVTSTGEVVGNFMRIVTRHEDGSYSIEHGILKIENKEYRGTGFGKIFSKVSEDLYRKLGISRIELNAADENGAATWAKAGYYWAERPRDVLNNIRRFIDETGLYDEEGDETVPGSRAFKEKHADAVEVLKDIYYRFERYELGSENYPTPLEIVNIPEIGKYILREGTEWAGVKYLNKEEPVAKPEVVDAPIVGEWEKDGAVESRGESTVLNSILTDEGFKVDGSPDKPLSAVDADVVSDDHKKAVDLYTRSSLWRSINSYLRGDLEEQESSKNIEETIPLLDEAIAENGEVFEAGRVFRGQRIDRSQSGKNWAEFMDKLQPGDVYSDEAYLSTSNSSLLAAREFGIGSYGTWETIAQGTVTADAPGGNGSIFWAIDVPVGTTAFAVPDGMGYAQGAEREVILPRGSKFVIKGVRRVEQNNPDADPDAPKSYNYFVDAELLPVEVPKAVDAPMVEEQPEKAKLTLPLPPRSLPIPEGHIRLFHYTNDNVVESIRKNGLIAQEGSAASYDDNISLIWAAEGAPVGGDGQFTDRPIVEFHVPEEIWAKGAGLGFERAAMDLPVPPENILAIHEPWQFLVREVLAIKQTPEQFKYNMDLVKKNYDRQSSDYKKVIDYFDQNPPEGSEIVDAPTVEETEDWVEVDGVQSRGESEIFAGVLTGDKFEYGGLRRPIAMADSGNFTYEQQRALSNYTGSDFKDINDYLRTGEFDEDSIYDEETMNSELEEIDAAIAENGYVEEDATVFRGMKIKRSTVTDSGESWASVLENFKVGDVYHEKGYLSASNSPAVAHHAFASGGLPDYFETTEDVSNNAFERGTAFWAINVPEGSTALALPVNDENFEITGDEREEEVILPRGSALKIKAIRRVKQNRDDGEEAYNYYIEAVLLPVRKTVESATEDPEVVDAPPLQTWVEVDGVQKFGDAPLFDDGRLTDTEFEASDLGDLTPIPTDFSQTSEEQTKALLKYTREDYDLINSMLRGESLHPKQQKRVDDLSKSIELIDKTFESQAPTEYAKTVFRGLIFYRPELATLFEKLKPGDEWDEASYLSTSGNPLAARGFSMMRDENPSAANASNHNIKEAQGTAFWAINLPEGSKALDISEVSQYGTESEILLPRGSKLKIEGIRRVRQNRKDGAEYYNYYVQASLVSEPAEVEAVDGVTVFDNNPFEVYTWLDDSGTENLTNEEIDSMSKYQASGYVNINRHLRGLQSYGGWLLDSVLDHVKNLDSIISKSKGTPTDAILYRAIFNSDPLKFSDISVGSVLSDKGFLSTTSSKDFLTDWLKREPEGGFMVKLTVPEGTKVVSPYTKIPDLEFKDEYEVIIGRDTDIQVTSIDYENKIVEGILLSSPKSEASEVDAPTVEEVEEPVKSGPGFWGRRKLREVKDRLARILDDPEVVEILEEYSNSDESVEKLRDVLEERGIFRKESASDLWNKGISAAEKKYKDSRDRNIDTETGIAPPAPYGAIPDSGLGSTGYVKSSVIQLVDNLIIDSNTQASVSALKDEIGKNGFTSPVVLLYNKETNTYSLKNPKTDSDRILAAKEISTWRNIPVVVEVNGESYNPRFMPKLNTPEDLLMSDPVEEEYVDISGVPDLPVLERSQAEKFAIETYRGWGYLDVKTHMESPYGHPDKTQEERDKLDEIVDNLDKLTSTEPIPEGTVLYRGFELNGSADQEWYDYFLEVEAGDRLIMPIRFSSTTLDIDVAEGFAFMSGNKIAPEDMRSVVLKLVTAEGATGAAFENDKTVFSREKEVLLPMLANVTVTNVYKDADGVLRVEGIYGPKESETVDAPIVEVVPSKSEGESDALDSIFVGGTVNLDALRSPVAPVAVESMSSESYASLVRYASFDYKDINGHLRGHGTNIWGKGEEGLKRDVENHISHIDEAIEGAGELTENARFFRGVGLTEKLLEEYENLKPGDVLEDNGYLSTSMNPQTALNYGPFNNFEDVGVLIINAPTGSNALAIPTELTGPEEEVLLPRGTKLKVRAIRRTESVDKSGVTRYKYYVEADVVPVDAPKVEEPIEDDAEEKLREALEGLENYIPRDEPAPEIEEIQDTTPGGVTHTFNGKEFYFSPEELEKARYYVSKGYRGARDITDEEGKAFNEEMRALTDYKNPGTVSDETLPAQREYMGKPIPVGELRHSAPPGRFEEIMQDGIRPKITDKVGSERYSRRRFGVFLANDYTSTEAGRLAEVFRVKVPENELRVDSGYTPNGANLYIERTIKPEEIEHIGHIPADASDAAIEVKDAGLHDGRGPECPICNPELAPAKSETVQAPEIEETPATRTISTVADLVENHEELQSRIEEIEKSSESKVEKGDVPMRALLEMMGKGGKPEMVDPSVLAGREIFYRGGPGFAIDSLKYSATDRIGLGVYGNGYYFSNLTDTAEIYSAMGPGGIDAGAVVSVVWKPTAKVYNIDDLDIKLPPGYNIKMYLYTIANEAKEGALKELNFPDKMTDAQRAIYKLFFSDQDVDAFTTTLILDGYDGLSFTFEGKHNVQEKYTIVFNREALQIADI